MMIKKRQTTICLFFRDAELNRNENRESERKYFPNILTFDTAGHITYMSIRTNKDEVYQMEIIPYKSKTVKMGNQTLEYADFSHNILKNRREDMNLTQQVADQAEILLRQYQRLESGERDITGASARIMLSVCEVLKLDPYLFWGKTSRYWNGGKTETHTKHIVLPPIETNGIHLFIPEYAYILLVSQIPYGRIAISDTIEKILTEAYGLNSYNLKSNFNSMALYLSKAFPFWRVVSKRGYLFDVGQSTDKESNGRLLSQEGIEVKQMEEKYSFFVPGYKSYVYEFEDV